MALDLNHLEALVAVADCGSITKAAQRLRKVRSAVSYDVRCLESQLGVPLVDRSGYRARLTVVGERVVQEGAQLLGQARALEHLATRLGEDWEPVVKMVVEGAIPISPVMRAIKELNARDVPTRIELQTDFLGGVLERFEREEADLMLVRDFDASLEEYTVHRLPEINCLLVAASEHPLFHASDHPLQLDDLRPHLELNIQVVAEGGPRLPDKRVGVPRVLHLAGFYAKKEALLMGLGFGWMPETLIEDALADGRLKKLPFAGGASFQFTPSLMSQKSRALGQAGRLFRDLVLAAFQ